MRQSQKAVMHCDLLLVQQAVNIMIASLPGSLILQLQATENQPQVRGLRETIAAQEDPRELPAPPVQYGCPKAAQHRVPHGSRSAEPVG